MFNSPSKATPSRSAAEETFRTPELEPGSSYTYTFKAEVVREGKTVAFTKQVKVRAGQTSEADFTKLATEGKDVARVTVKLPADARLYVDDVLCPLTSTTRSFNTPELEAGRPYYYTLKAEFVNDGQTRKTRQRGRGSRQAGDGRVRGRAVAGCQPLIVRSITSPRREQGDTCRRRGLAFSTLNGPPSRSVCLVAGYAIIDLIRTVWVPSKGVQRD